MICGIKLAFEAELKNHFEQDTKNLLELKLYETILFKSDYYLSLPWNVHAS